MKKIYVKGFVGNIGTKILIEEKTEELQKYFSEAYLKSTKKNLDLIIKGGDNPSLSIFNDIVDSEDIGKGGVLSSLWKLCERNNWGLEYSLRRIPILQSTIEIANYFDLNPYRLLTSNAKLIVVDIKLEVNNVNYAKMLEVINLEIEKYNTICQYSDMISEIGEINNTKKRVRVDGEVEAFLTKDYKDEIDKIIPKCSKDYI